VKAALFALMFAGPLGAQMSFYIDSTNGAAPSNQLQALPSSYSFPDASVGSASAIVLRAVNTSSASITLNAIFVGAAAGSTTSTPNFTLTGLPVNSTLAPQTWKDFTINFTPSVTGSLSGYLQALVNGNIVAVSTLTGNGTPAAITLSCAAGSVTQCDGSILQPFATTPIYFGNVLTTASAPVTFTLTNNSATPFNSQSLITISTPTNNPNTPFSLSGVPSSIAPGTSATFTVAFAPGDTNTYQTTLNVGSNSYLIQGSGVASVVGDITSLAISYSDSTGVRLTAQPATPISFGQVVAGTNSANTLTFTVTNPQSTISAVSVSNIAVTGVGFSVSGLPTLPATIQPGSSITFKVSFLSNSIGTYNGTLAIGTRLFSITGQSITSPLPDMSFQIDQPTLTSGQQVHLKVQLVSASSVSAIGALSLKFTPAVNGIVDDPAINFTATSGRSVQISVASGDQTASYNGQSAITFQTGTTAGTLIFTATFPNKAPYSQSFEIMPAQINITESTAIRQPPNLVVTVAGYDNTYTAGKLNYSFYDTSGKLLTPTPIAIDATSAFHQYFFTISKVGGAFAVQATFPLKGMDVSNIGKVAVGLSNSAGSTSATQAFQ
jgi:hypothetical protein